MITLFRNLEPRFEEKDEILYNELDEVNEIFFMERGMVNIGFELNRK